MAKKKAKKTTRPTARKTAAKRVAARAKRPKATRPKRQPAKVARPSSPAVNPIRALARQIVELTTSHQEERAFSLYADTIESIEPGMPPLVGMAAIRQKLGP